MNPHWLDIAREFDLDNFLDLPQDAELIHSNGISLVYHSPHFDMIFKRSIPFLIENELYCLDRMCLLGHAPDVQRFDKYTLAMPYLENQGVQDAESFMPHKEQILNDLFYWGIRHGDLTTANIIVNENIPFVIDWAESRLWGDTRPDKRPEGDEYWLNKTFEELCNGLAP